jgi:peptide/nickel transport system permease protein
MPFKLEFLWTDALVWLLVAVSLFFAWYVRRQPHLRAPWRRVGQSASGMASLTVLIFFVAVGLLDSIHVRTALPSQQGAAAYSTQARSVLDLLAAPLKARAEKTYSAPLATHLFAKETITAPGERERREFPRLKFAGERLQDPARDWSADVLARISIGAAAGAAAWLALAALLTLALGARRGGFGVAWLALWRGETEVRWRAVLITLLLMLLTAGAVAALAGHYHVLGTDKVGQDVLLQALKAFARPS